MRKSTFTPEQTIQPLRQARAVRDEKKLKQILADLTLDKTILPHALGNKW